MQPPGASMRFLFGLISNRGTTWTVVGSNSGQPEETAFAARSMQGQAPAGLTSRGVTTAETTAAARDKARKSKQAETAKQFPVRSGGSGLGKFGKLGDTSVPLPSPHHRNPVIPGGAELRRPLFNRRPCLHTFTAQQPLGPVHIARASPALCPRMPDNGASRKVKRRWSVPRHSTIGPSCTANGRSFEHHQPPAAPNVSRVQDQLSDSSSSPGTPPWPATAANPATTAAEAETAPSSTRRSRRRSGHLRLQLTICYWCENSRKNEANTAENQRRESSKARVLHKHTPRVKDIVACMPSGDDSNLDDLTDNDKYIPDGAPRLATEDTDTSDESSEEDEDTGVDENRSLVITAKNGQEWMALFDICEVELLGLSATTWMEQRQ
ncbi:hypothetical protein HPB50_005018 [Hyalomma asiaticum]|uniref:Uncharacterized protein n=1 Tax=Hyalomma asiaticum TaxID=266040 RepID=A0ACB7SND6_HYAAI|nr:hypothetical protein HPB50_005018 [Hyalomma asiaticum]